LFRSSPTARRAHFRPTPRIGLRSMQ
jgi:hypothetical protein